MPSYFVESMKLILSLVTLFACVSLSAASVNCRNVEDCLTEYSKVSGLKHVTYNNLKKAREDKPFSFEGDLKDIEEAFTFYLHQNGYTRVKAQSKSFFIVPSRDIRYIPTTLYSGESPAEIPKNYDYITVSIELKNKLLGTQITRNLRPFMSRYGRIIINEGPGIITFQEIGVNVHRVLKLVEKIDKPFSEKEKKEFLKKKKHDEQMQIKRLKYSKHKKS